MVRIKICGITSVEDAILAADLGADALGFMFYRGSKRYIPPETARDIINRLPPFIVTVGVFVNQKLDEIRYLKEKVGFDIVQLHGDESPEFCRELGERVIKAIRIKESVNSKEVESYPSRAILFDTYSQKGYGGTGESFRWEVLRELKTTKKVILSGGLTPENVSEAIKIVKPYAVDVSTGVEERPAKKDPEKLKKFIEAVRYETQIPR